MKDSGELGELLPGKEKCQKRELVYGMKLSDDNPGSGAQSTMKQYPCLRWNTTARRAVGDNGAPITGELHRIGEIKCCPLMFV